MLYMKTCAHVWFVVTKAAVVKVVKVLTVGVTSQVTDVTHTHRDNNQATHQKCYALRPFPNLLLCLLYVVESFRRLN